MMQRPIFSGAGIHVGRIRGVDIQVHWLLVLLALWNLHRKIQLSEDTRRGVLLWLTEFVALFATILLHELGHVFAARRVGGWAREIVLWPLGGLAYCDAPQRPIPQFVVAAGGPAVNVVIIGVTLAVFYWLLPAGFGGESVRNLRFTLVQWNWILLLFNLLPVYPLDGGRMFHALAWGILTWRRTLGAYGRAVAATVWAARITAGVGVLLALTDRFPLAGIEPTFVIIILLWGWYATEQLRR